MLLATVLAVSAAAAPPPVIRTGGPTEPRDFRVAVVGDGRAGQRFRVTRCGRVVYRARLTQAQGDPAPFARAAVADLHKLRKPGRYVVRVGKLRSRPVVIRRGARDAFILRLLRLYVVNAETDSPVFGTAHGNDAVLEDGRRVDLTGGWRDAGDALKFTRTTAQSVAYLHLAARMAPGSADRLREVAAVGERYLLKANPFPGVFVHTVGDERDHETGFRDFAQDEDSGLPGIAQRTAYTTTSSDVLGMTAAALALSGHLEAAKTWYAQARATDAQQVADQAFYPDDAVHDELAFAASQLWRATGEQRYLDEALEQLDAGSEDELYGGVVMGAPRGIVVADLCGGLGAPAAPGEAKALPCDDLGKLADVAFERARERAFASPGIYTFGWVQDNGGAGVVAAAAERAGLEPDGGNLAGVALGYLTGANQWGRSFVVGPGRGEAKQPHHGAFLKGRPAQLLDGAVVGGPANPGDITGQGLPLKGSRYDGAGIAYEDKRADYVTSEVSLGYSSASILLAAALP